MANSNFFTENSSLGGLVHSSALIYPIRGEFLDHTLFWNAADLERKLADFQSYFNEYRVHSALDGHTPAEVSGERVNRQATLHDFRW